MKRMGMCLALACLAVTACAKDSTGPGSAYAGAWEGTTSQGLPVRFWVENDGVRLLTTTDSVVGSSCTSYITRYLESSPPDTAFPLTGDAMTIASSGGSGAYTFQGTFTSTTQASGTLARTNTACNGSGSVTWTATKVTAAAVNLTGTWSGTFSSSLIDSTYGTFTISQSGTSLTGSWTFDNGGVGTITGTVAGHLAKFSVNETTTGCRGSFTGHGAVHTSPQFLFLGWAGTDCLGTHHKAGGIAF